MSLDLDARQRAMLLEMNVRLWQRPSQAAPTAAERAAGLPTVAAAAAAAPVKLAPPPAVSRPAAASPAARPSVVEPTPTPGLPATWLALQQAVGHCQACALCTGRKAAVWGASTEPAQADWLVVGDPPEELEEREGRPLVGAAGQLLNNMLKAIQASRDGTGRAGAYITNIVKCRPAMPRNPSVQELATCQAYLQQEIALVKPKLILALGRFAAQSLLQSSMPDVASIPLGRLRGQVHQFQGIPVVVSYHPTYLLRTPADKGKAWADLCLALATLDAAASDQP